MRERERERERAREREEKDERDLAITRSRRREIREEEFELCLSFFWVVACVFLDLCFPSSFPNTRKYFSENFLKCNQTHENIFLSGNAFTRTKHSLCVEDSDLCAFFAFSCILVMGF